MNLTDDQENPVTTIDTEPFNHNRPGDIEAHANSLRVAALALVSAFSGLASRGYFLGSESDEDDMAVLSHQVALLDDAVQKVRAAVGAEIDTYALSVNRLREVVAVGRYGHAELVAEFAAHVCNCDYCRGPWASSAAAEIER